MSGSVEIEGEIDAATVDAMKQRINEAIDAQPGARITLDMGKVTFLDSTGLGALISARRLARDGGGDITITNIAPNVRRVFDITGLDKAFELD